MGNSQPKNYTGKKVIAQKLDSAKKIGVLSLSEHGLDHIPTELFDEADLRKLRTLDLSKNNLASLGKLGLLQELKSLNLDSNKLHAGSLSQLALLIKLQNLSLAKNKIGFLSPSDPKKNSTATTPVTDSPSNETLPELPSSLKQLCLASNSLSFVPRPVYSINLSKLEKLDISNNQLATLPVELVNLKNLEELNCDDNMIVSVAEEIGRGLRKLKVLSLRNNKLTVSSTTFSAANPQPIPKSLFTDTLLIDLNLHGNKMTSTQMNNFDGYQEFLDRRQKVKSKTMTNLDVCGLD